MFSNDGPITITTIKLKIYVADKHSEVDASMCNTARHTQFVAVLNAFAGARMRRPTISAGYNHVMPNQPRAKNELNTNSRIHEMTWAAEFSERLPRIARRTNEMVCPMEPMIMSFRLPTRSMMKIAMRLARKYSVPLHAATMRDFVSDSPRSSKRMV